MHDYPKITIVTVVYNAAATIQQAIESILQQTSPDFEYIIIDGKSTDGTVEIIKQFQHGLSYWISEKDNGIYDAMNKGIKASKGEWIIFLGADDVFFSKNVLSQIFIENKTDGIDFIYGNAILKSTGKISGGSRSYEQLIGRNINHQSIFYKKTIFEKTGLYSLRYKILADYDLNLRIFRNSSIIKKYIPQAITLYNNKGLSNQVIDGNFFEDQLEYFINVEKLSSKDYRLQPYFFFYGFAHFLHGSRIKGFKIILYSLTFGKRKFYYFLVSIKYFLSIAGFWKKMRTSFTPKSKAEIKFNNR